MKTPACVWRISPELIAALDERFGDPVDAYVNGSQTWLIENGPDEITIEWRLHPVANYERPPNTETHAVFRHAADGRLEPATLWDGLEAFPAYDDEAASVDPKTLAAATAAALDREPDATGKVDHDVIGDEWERTTGGISVVDRLLAQLTAAPPRAESV
ncbi:MAG TPA: hypothetical protein VF230_13435 [Acidimicrobiales bacterium]